MLTLQKSQIQKQVNRDSKSCLNSHYNMALQAMTQGQYDMTPLDEANISSEEETQPIRINPDESPSPPEKHSDVELSHSHSTGPALIAVPPKDQLPTHPVSDAWPIQKSIFNNAFLRCIYGSSSLSIFSLLSFALWFFNVDTSLEAAFGLSAFGMSYPYEVHLKSKQNHIF